MHRGGKHVRCSLIKPKLAGCIIEISEDKALNMHQYLGNVKKNGAQFEQTYNDYRKKYALELSE